ncbi:19056_t:CDS:2 [Gigaspora margarita]|uniref:19056_t:CDS:1 n=1 Tax=Gigaspora margarita TaxID=4874 RepID=A0ABM8W1H5_GIGMA|nr:19056_t:CDS:2 [Gigaspora margarita]
MAKHSHTRGHTIHQPYRRDRHRPIACMETIIPSHKYEWMADTNSLSDNLSEKILNFAHIYIHTHIYPKPTTSSPNHQISMESNSSPKSPDEPTDRAAITIDISKIDSNAKAYIDVACQNTANTIIASIKSYIDQHSVTQTASIDKLNKCIDQCFDQI